MRGQSESGRIGSRVLTRKSRNKTSDRSTVEVGQVDENHDLSAPVRICHPIDFRAIRQGRLIHRFKRHTDDPTGADCLHPVARERSRSDPLTGENDSILGRHLDRYATDERDRI